MGRQQPNIWPDLRRLWTVTTAAHLDLSPGDEDDGQEATLRALCISLARFARNLVAAVPHNQERALSAMLHPHLTLHQLNGRFFGPQ